MARAGSVLIAGYGYVGARLGERLQQEGYEVWALCREPRPVADGVRTVRADLTRPSTLTLPPGIDHVVFCASAGASTDDAYRRLYVEGLENLLAALARARSTPRVFFTSSTAVYAQDDGSWVNEASPTEPTRFSGQRTLEAERVLEQSGLRCTVLRCSGIYGPGRQSLVQGLKAGTLRVPPRDRHTNRIHRDDVAGFIHHLIATGKEVERVLVSDDEPALYSTVIATLAERLGVSVPPVDPQATPARFGGDKRCDNRRLHELGYTLRYPSFREGYADAL